MIIVLNTETDTRTVLTNNNVCHGDVCDILKILLVDRPTFAGDPHEYIAEQIGANYKWVKVLTVQPIEPYDKNALY